MTETDIEGRHTKTTLHARGVNIDKKETPTQLFSCEFCEIFKYTFSTEHLRATASGLNALAKI